MANLQVKDGAEATKYLKASGAGTDGDPHIVEHLDTNSAAMLAALQTLDNIVSGSEAQVDVVTLPGTSETDIGAIKTAVEILDNIVSGSEAQVDVVTLPGTAEADITAIKTAVEILDNIVSGTEAQVDVVTLPGTVETDIGAIKTAIEILDNAISGSEMQVDVVGALPTGTNTIGKTQPFDAVLELGVTELIGINEQVDQNDYCASVGVALGGTYSGELLNITLYSTEDGSGGVRTPDGILYCFDADPSISSGDTAMSAAARVTQIGKWSVASTDWDSDANGASAVISTPQVFHAVSTLYFAFKLTSATSFNDAAGDDEQLEFNAWYRRDS